MLKRSLTGLNKSSREVYNSAVNSDIGDTQQGRVSNLRSLVGALNLSGHSQDCVLCQQPRGKYSLVLAGLVLKAAFHKSPQSVPS